MIGLATQIFSVSGAVVLTGTEGSELSAIGRRVSRTATLDGGVVITHNGVVQGDRTLRVAATLTEADTLLLRDIFEEETEVTLACVDGLFRGALERLSGDEGRIELTFLVKEKIA